MISLNASNETALRSVMVAVMNSEMMGSGNKEGGGGLFCLCGVRLLFATVVGYGSWFLFVFHFCSLFLVCKIGDKWQ